MSEFTKLSKTFRFRSFITPTCAYCSTDGDYGSVHDDVHAQVHDRDVRDRGRDGGAS